MWGPFVGFCCFCFGCWSCFPVSVAKITSFKLYHPPKKVSFVCQASYQCLEPISIMMQKWHDWSCIMWHHRHSSLLLANSTWQHNWWAAPQWLSLWESNEKLACVSQHTHECCASSPILSFMLLTDFQADWHFFLDASLHVQHSLFASEHSLYSHNTTDQDWPSSWDKLYKECRTQAILQLSWLIWYPLVLDILLPQTVFWQSHRPNLLCWHPLLMTHGFPPHWPPFAIWAHLLGWLVPLWLNHQPPSAHANSCAISQIR